MSRRYREEVWDHVPLGEYPDAEIAREFGAHPTTVASARRRRGIPSWRARVRKIDWDSLPLGDRPDSELAQELGVSVWTVTRARRERGIPCWRHRISESEWDSLPLGERPDSELAQELGVAVWTVTLARRERKITPWRPPGSRTLGNPWGPRISESEWDSLPLGERPDSELAQELGVAVWTVTLARRERKITSWRPPGSRKLRNPWGPRVSESVWDEQPLGDRPDSELAQELGVSVWTVTRARRERGIPRWRSRTSEYDWDSLPLGERPDSELAREFGVSVSAVTRARRERKISCWRPPGARKLRDAWPHRISESEWDSLPLGEGPDSELAQQLGVSVWAVTTARKERMITCWRPPGSPEVRKPRRPHVAEPDWDSLPLGEGPDSELAQQLGVSVSAVSRARQKRKITNWLPHAGHSKIDWDSLPLGQELDTDIAQQLGVLPSAVNKARWDRQIPKRVRGVLSHAEWDSLPLGKVSDQELARSLGIPARNVGEARRRRGIPPLPPPGKIDWESQPLGQISDGELARRLGCAPHSVLYARRRRGIPKFTPPPALD